MKKCVELNYMNTNDIIRLKKDQEVDVIGNIISPESYPFSNTINKAGNYKLIINNTEENTYHLIIIEVKVI